MRGRHPGHLLVSALLGIAALVVGVNACGVDVTGTLPVDANVLDASIEAGPIEDAAPVACTVATDCPAPADDCVVVACTNSTCATTNVATGTPCATSGGAVCDGNGHCSACVVADDCPASLTACKINACTSNACGAANAAPSSACDDNGGRVCDASGSCAECSAAKDCPLPNTECRSNTCDAGTCGVAFADQGKSCASGTMVCDGKGTCVPTHCTNGLLDGPDEADVDCGGTCGATCKDTSPQQKCKIPGDCISGICKGNLCQPPACNDAVRNGNETDIDCGGAGFNGKNPCPKCADKKQCAKNSDCAKNSCFGANPGICVSCTDGTKDGTETDQDCGGATCDGQNKKCAVGKVCVGGGDCQTGYCASGTCQLLPDGKACTVKEQCLHGACLNVPGGGKVCCATACKDNGAPSCATNGMCQASGTACAVYTSGTPCGAAMCAGNMLTTKSCDGAGACQTGTSACPGNLDCAGPSCLKSCGSNDDKGDAKCVTGFWCDGATCQPPQGAGVPCTRAPQCQGMCNPGQHQCK